MNGISPPLCLIALPPGALRDHLVAALSSLEQTVIEVCDPQTAERHSAALVLLAGASGLSALEAFTKTGVRVLYLSEERALRRQALEQGAAEVADPTALEETRGRVTHMLRLAALEATGGAANAPEAIASEVVLLDLEGRIVAANASWRRGCEARGGPADHWIGHSYPEVCARAIGAQPEAVEAIIAAIRELGRGDLEEQRVEYRCSFDATARDCVALITRFDSPELESRILLVHEDISKLRRAEQASREREELWRAVGLNSPDFISIVDRDLRFRFVNRVVAGSSLELVIGARLLDFNPPDSQGVIERVLREVLATGEPGRCETRYIDRQGTTRYYSNRIGRIRRGSEDEILMFSTEITDQKRAEDERRTLENQLRQSQKMEALGQLAGGVAHDFNNMLGVILGQGELLGRDSSLNDKARHRVSSILDAASQSASLTRQLLAISRKQVLELTALDLNDLVQASGALIERLIGEDIKLRYDLDSRLGLIEADPSQMKQVLMNLALNARDAMPGGGELRLETRALRLSRNNASLGLPSGHCAMLRVSDDGAGMSPEVRQRIFEPFFTTKEKGKGTGLGLSTAYGIVKQIGGEIEVESSPGQGTVVTITLPVIETRTAEAASQPPDTATGTGTILLVEDKAIVREVVREMLEKMGFEVMEAASAEQALDIFNRDPDIALVLTDIILTGMNGRALAERLKSMDPGLKVLFMTGYTDDAISDRGLSRGDSRILEKPFSFQALADAVSESLGHG